MLKIPVSLVQFPLAPLEKRELQFGDSLFLWLNIAKTGKCFLQCFNRNDNSRCDLLQVQTSEKTGSYPLKSGFVRTEKRDI